MEFGGTYALLTRASISEVVRAVGVPADVGTLAGWTVAALDPDQISTQWPDGTPDRLSAATGEPVLAVWDGGGACGVAGSASGESEPMMWTEGWEPPGRLFRGRWLRGWREAAADVATRAGLRARGDALGEVYQTGGVPCRDLLLRAVTALDLPAGVIGTRLGHTTHLTDVVRTTDR